MLNHCSYSSILLFLNHPAAWHSKYVLGIKDQQTNPAALTGVAFHKYMEGVHRGVPLPLAKEVAVAQLKATKEVNFGKTGNVEKCLQNLNNLITAYHAETPTLGKILGVEVGYEQKVPGIKLPIKCYIDLLHEMPDGVEVLDWKSVSAYEEEPTPAQIVQAVMYYWVVKKAHKVTPVRFRIVQIKASKNSDGSPQVKPLEIVYAEHPEYLRGVKRLVTLALRQMTRKLLVALPNPRDSYEGREEFDRFLAASGQPLT